MPLFLGVHRLSAERSDALVENGWRSYCEGCRALGVKPLAVVYSVEKGVAYCQTEASSADDVWKAHEQVAIPLEDVLEVRQLPGV